MAVTKPLMSRANLTASGLDIASFVKEDAAAASNSAAPNTTRALAGGGVGAVADSGKPVILQYAAYLGMDVAADTDLLWIAQQALVAELPPGWTEHADPMSGDAYFHNAQTGETVWEHPCDSYYRNLCATTPALLPSPVQGPFCLAWFALAGITPELSGARSGTRH